MDAVRLLVTSGQINEAVRMAVPDDRERAPDMP
jgi:hypothetical protein